VELKWKGELKTTLQLQIEGTAAGSFFLISLEVQGGQCMGALFLKSPGGDIRLAELRNQDRE